MPEEKNEMYYDIELPKTIIESFARFLVTEMRNFYTAQEGNGDGEKT